MDLVFILCCIVYCVLLGVLLYIMFLYTYTHYVVVGYIYFIFFDVII